MVILTVALVATTPSLFSQFAAKVVGSKIILSPTMLGVPKIESAVSSQVKQIVSPHSVTLAACETESPKVNTKQARLACIDSLDNREVVWFCSEAIDSLSVNYFDVDWFFVRHPGSS